jgi:hypothetical protein
MPDGNDTSLPVNVWANLWWGTSRGAALACLPVAIRMLLQGGYLASRIPGTPSPGTRLQVDLATFAFGAGLGAVAGLLRPLTRSFLGSLLFGVLLVEIGAMGFWYFVRQSMRRPDLSTLVAVVLFGLVLGAAAYISQQSEKRQV